MFEDMLKQNQSIMAAYKAMQQSDDTGGDGSAYNKYLLAKTGDLPRSKEEYMKVDESECGDEVEEEKKMKGKDPCWDGYEMAGTKEKDGKTVPNCIPSK